MKIENFDEERNCEISDKLEEKRENVESGDEKKGLHENIKEYGEGIKGKLKDIFGKSETEKKLDKSLAEFKENFEKSNKPDLDKIVIPEPMKLNENNEGKAKKSWELTAEEKSKANSIDLKISEKYNEIMRKKANDSGEDGKETHGEDGARTKYSDRFM